MRNHKKISHDFTGKAFDNWSNSDGFEIYEQPDGQYRLCGRSYDDIVFQDATMAEIEEFFEEME